MTELFACSCMQFHTFTLEAEQYNKKVNCSELGVQSMCHKKNLDPQIQPLVFSDVSAASHSLPQQLTSFTWQLLNNH